MAYNLLGQQGTKGTRNPDPNLSDAEATYLYNDPPGGKVVNGVVDISQDGDNKGLLYTSYGNQVVDVEAHNKKADDAATEQSRDSKVKPGSSVDLSNTSFGEKESVDAAEVLPPITSKERKSIKSFSDLAKLTSSKRLEENDITLLLGLNPEWTREDINQIIAGESIPWWKQMGFDSIDEADSEFGRGSLDMKDYEKFKKEQDEIDKALENRSTATSTTSTTTQANNPAYQVTIYKDGQEKTLDVRDPQLQGFLDDDWSTEKTVGVTTESEQYLASTQVTIYKDGQEKNVDYRTVDSYVTDGWSTNKAFVPVTSSSPIDTSSTDTSLTTSSQDFVSDQVIVLGPNGARTTANKNKRPGEDMSEYDRLIAGLIPGREGYKDADKIDYVDTYGGHQTGESVNPDYKGDYGGEDGSTPDSEKESLVGAGNTGYDDLDKYENFVDGSLTTTTTISGATQTSTETYDFVNIPNDAQLWNVNGDLFVVYQVPGDSGELYDGNPVFLAYDVPNNDLIEAGVLSPEAPDAVANFTLTKELFDSIAVVTGNTNQLSSLVENPFSDFVETVGEQAQIAPWITDGEMIEIIAEAAVEGRKVEDAEWKSTQWWKTHTESERDWLIQYNGDPATATQTKTDTEIRVANALKASGVSNAPASLVNWVASKFYTGGWSENYTNQQISLFADPYAQGNRDSELETYLSSTALTGIDRTSEKEREVEELFKTWLGPTLGKVTDKEKAELAGKLRDNPDYKDTLIGSLKQSRLAAFSAYTNPELTYDDIARPWRNLTTSVWGQTADETQGWWQEMVKTNDFNAAQTTLREKGLETNVTQVTQDAGEALTKALGQGNISQSGVNV